LASFLFSELLVPPLRFLAEIFWGKVEDEGRDLEKNISKV
jgi:hypothetical protein